jgi:hypothetical protein
MPVQDWTFRREIGAGEIGPNKQFTLVSERGKWQQCQLVRRETYCNKAAWCTAACPNLGQVPVLNFAVESNYRRLKKPVRKRVAL